MPNMWVWIPSAHENLGELDGYLSYTPARWYLGIERQIMLFQIKTQQNTQTERDDADM